MLIRGCRKHRCPHAVPIVPRLCKPAVSRTPPASRGGGCRSERLPAWHHGPRHRLHLPGRGRSGPARPRARHRGSLGRARRHVRASLLRRHLEARLPRRRSERLPHLCGQARGRSGPAPGPGPGAQPQRPHPAPAAAARAGSDAAPGRPDGLAPHAGHRHRGGQGVGAAGGRCAPGGAPFDHDGPQARGALPRLGCGP
jgi:hypothetical protein